MCKGQKKVLQVQYCICFFILSFVQSLIVYNHVWFADEWNSEYICILYAIKLIAIFYMYVHLIAFLYAHKKLVIILL